jgi:hypothetical protein
MAICPRRESLYHVHLDSKDAAFELLQVIYQQILTFEYLEDFDRPYFFAAPFDLAQSGQSSAYLSPPGFNMMILPYLTADAPKPLRNRPTRTTDLT